MLSSLSCSHTLCPGCMRRPPDVARAAIAAFVDGHPRQRVAASWSYTASGGRGSSTRTSPRCRLGARDAAPACTWKWQSTSDPRRREVARGADDRCPGPRPEPIFTVLDHRCQSVSPRSSRRRPCRRGGRGGDEPQERACDWVERQNIAVGSTARPWCAHPSRTASSSVDSRSPPRESVVLIGETVSRLTIFY